jgi:hypothetical protein
MTTGGWKTASMFCRYAIVSSADQRDAMEKLELNEAKAGDYDSSQPSEISPCRANPNAIMQSLISALDGLQVPFLCDEAHELGEELDASSYSGPPLSFIIGSKSTTSLVL